MRLNREGYTLVELLIALAVLVFLAALLATRLMWYVEWKKKELTRRRLEKLRLAIKLHYEKNAGYIDAAQGDVYTVFHGKRFVTINSDPNGNGELKKLAEAFAGTYTDLSEWNAWHDAWNRPFVFMVKRFTVGKPEGNYNGNYLVYRVIAVLSKGQNHVLDSQYDPSTGRFQLKGDDLVVYVNGYDVEAEKLEKTRERLRRIAKGLESIYLTLFAADPLKDVTVDRFLRVRKDCSTTEDKNSPLENSCCVASRVTPLENLLGGCWATAESLGLANALGLSINDLKTAWWGTDAGALLVDDIGINNGSAPARTPESGGPPYTAWIGAVTPWRTALVEVAEGTI